MPPNGNGDNGDEQVEEEVEEFSITVKDPPKKKAR
jgi:hypothetical protein